MTKQQIYKIAATAVTALLTCLAIALGRAFGTRVAKVCTAMLNRQATEASASPHQTHSVSACRGPRSIPRKPIKTMKL